MKTITLDIEDSYYCDTNIPLPAFPIPLKDKNLYKEGEIVIVEMPKIKCKVKTRVDLVETKDVSWVFEGRTIPSSYMNERNAS